MKRYHSRVAAVLRVRRIEERRAAATLGAALRGVAVAETALELVRARYDQQVWLCGTQAGSVFLAHRAQLDRLAEAVQKRRADVGVAEHFATECRAGWSLAAQRVAALEHLDERRRSEHRRDQLRHEAALSDDRNAMRRQHPNPHSDHHHVPVRAM